MLLTDLAGGTPSNIAGVYAKKYGTVYAVCGLNMEMLICADNLRNTYYGGELVDKIENSSKRKNIKFKKIGED